MDDWKLEHVVQGLQDLNWESFGQSDWEALEIIVFNELVQIDAEHFESDTHMTSESKVFSYPYNIFCVLMILVTESF